MLVSKNNPPSEGYAGDKGAGHETPDNIGTHEPANRREFLVILAALVFSGCTNRSEPDHEEIAKKVARNYGSLEEPLFQAQLDLPYEKFPNYRESHQAQVLKLTPEETSRLSRDISNLEQQLDSFTNRLDLLTPAAAQDLGRKYKLQEEYFDLASQISKVQRAFLEAQARMHERALQENSARLTDLRDSANDAKREHAEEVHLYGPPEQAVRRLVRGITNRDLPIDIQFEIRSDRNERRLGYSRATQNLAVAHEQGYPHMLMTLSHEVGHLMALHEEQTWLEKSPEPDLKRIGVWEEACAYAFEATVASYLCATDSPHASVVRSIVTTSFESLAREHYSGAAAETPHAEGVAILDAAYTVLGSYAATYNYLSSHTELTPEMLEVMKANKELGEPSYEIREDTQLLNLKERMAKLNYWIDTRPPKLFLQTEESP